MRVQCSLCSYDSHLQSSCSNRLSSLMSDDQNSAMMATSLLCSLRPPVSSQLAFLLSTSTPLPGQCERTTASPINNGTSDDYDIHIPLSAIPLGVNIGPSLEVLSFAKDAKTGELPWIARRGWLEVGDVLVSVVSLEGKYMSEVIMFKNRNTF